MTRVEQEGMYGCTFACLATITGLSYSEARDVFDKNFDNDDYPKGRWASLSPPMMLEALNDIFDIPCKCVKFTSLDELHEHCVLYVCPLEGCYTGVHAIVFDADKRELLDPSPGNQLSDLEKYNVVSCIETQ